MIENVLKTQKNGCEFCGEELIPLSMRVLSQGRRDMPLCELGLIGMTE